MTLTFFFSGKTGWLQRKTEVFSIVISKWYYIKGMLLLESVVLPFQGVHIDDPGQSPFIELCSFWQGVVQHLTVQSDQMRYS